MIKYFQKLKAKKGFTLVELIVVIAIIGVLAAILIPTMLGYVTQSKVTSANSTAASIKNEIDGYLTTCDTNGYGMQKSASKKATLSFKITSNGTWSVMVSDATVFNTGAGKNWTAASLTAAATKKSAANAATVLALDLKELFPEVKTGYIVAKLVGGKCTGVAYQNEFDTLTNDDLQKKLETTVTNDTGWWAGYGWDADTLGISNGHIVGTAPVLQLGPTAGSLSS